VIELSDKYSLNRLLKKLGPADLLILWLSILIAPIFVTIAFLIIFSFISINGFNAFFEKMSNLSLSSWGSAASVFSALSAVAILMYSRKLQYQSDKLRNYLFRSWPGSQTDYGANLTNTHTQKITEIERHIEDVEKGFEINDMNSLEEAGFLLSSIAYGLEHDNPQVLKRFIDVLYSVVGHPQFPTSNPKRIIKIGIWPIEEHQIIWGAKRESVIGCERIASQPVLKNLTEDADWRKSSASWAADYKRFKSVLIQLKRIGRLCEIIKEKETQIQFEIDEIEPWSGRGFYNKHGRDNTFSLLIATTPINSQTLKASHWTTTGFHSYSFDSYRQLSKILDTCIKTRYGYSDGTSSNAVVDEDGAINTDAVHLAVKFLDEPYKTLADYFLLQEGWEKWTEKERKSFYEEIHNYIQTNKKL